MPDFSAFVVRSNSTAARRKNPRGQSLKSGHADNSSFVHHQLFSDMQQQQDERPSRKIKKENKLYSFLARSRSRSRSKNEHEYSMADSTTPKSRSQAHINSGRRSGAATVVSGSKPPTRVQSRPLSSTTTATNTTIIPSTPKARRFPQPRIEKPLPTPILKTSRPTRDEPAKPRRRFHDLFSISLASLSRSRSRSLSRPGSPHLSLDVPPLPSTPGVDDDGATPRPRKSFSPHGARRTRSPSPTPTGPKVLRVVNATATASSSNGSTAASIKITKLFTKNNAPEPVLPPLPVFQPLRRISSLRRRSSLKEDQGGSHTNLPKLIGTPATPQKDGETITPPNGKIWLGSHGHAVKASLDSGLRYRAGIAAAMGVVDEEGRSEVASLNKGKPREGATSPPLPPLPRPPGPMRLSNSAKHGSFDFERPGWSGVGPLMMQRSGSGGTGGSTVSRETKGKDYTTGPGMAGVGTLQREASMKRAQEEQLKKGREREGLKEKKLPGDRDKEKTATPVHVHASTSTAGTNGTGPGKNSSLSKATGKRYTHTRAGNGKTGSGSGFSRLIGGHPHHGLFSFEPPVPTTSWSTGTGGSTSTTGTGYGQKEESREKTEREYERVQLEKAKEKERQTEMKKRGPKVSGDRPPVPVPSVPSMPTFPEGRLGGSSLVGHRSGQKGRSLDLGLGLAWAPSRVPEEALLPSSTLFVRGLNNGRSTENGTGSSSGHSGRCGRDKVGGEEEVEESKLGREVAEVFRRALDADGYRLFRHYVHQFDAHEIPFDGRNGIVSLVERLLAMCAPDLGTTGKRQLLDRFVNIILQQAGNTL